MFEVTAPHIKARHIARIMVWRPSWRIRIVATYLARCRHGKSILRILGAKKNLNAPWREVPLRKDLLYVMREWAAQDMRDNFEYLIHYYGMPVSSIKKAWAKTLFVAGRKRRICLYDLSHSFATELIASGVDVGTVAKLMGHSSALMILNIINT